MMIPKMRKKEMDNEYKAILDEYAQKEMARIEELKNSGEWHGGLDGNDGAFDDLKEEMNAKIKTLAKKYGIE